MTDLRVGVVGASGLVGTTILKVLAERDFPVGSLRLFASSRSAGQELEFRGEPVRVEELRDGFAQGLDVIFSSAGGSVSQQFLPQVRGTDAVAIDNTSAFRMDPDVPLVVPEVNPEDAATHSGIIANPNCSTIQAVVAVAPLTRAFGARRVVYSTYQSVSGSGTRGLRDLDEGTSELYPRTIRGNVIPQIGAIDAASGYSEEELKMMNETRKILHLPELRVSATTVRVPVRFGHAVAVNLECERPLCVASATAALTDAPGIVLSAPDDYPTPLEAEGRDEVFVGRVRLDPSVENGLDLWTVADNIRKGAATNAVQIGELLAGVAR